MTSPLNQPLTLPCGVEIPNRTFKSAMTEGLADSHDRATGRHNQLYKTWAEGGTGVLLTGNVMVDKRFLERPGNVVVDERTMQNGGFAALQAWAKAGTSNGNQLWVQISHPGRQVQKTVSKRPFAPSEVQLEIGGLFGRPRAMTEADIEDAIQRYAFVAKTVKDAGFTGVQIHAAHGYLISQFLSPVVNKRTDQWGGSLENRSRLLFAVIAAVRAAVGDEYPVAIKLNSSDFQKGGFSLEESAEVAAQLSGKIDLLEISGGTYEQPKLLGATGDEKTADAPEVDASGEQLRESTRKREAYFMQYIPKIRDAFTGPLCVTGGFRDRETMEQAVESGSVDVIGLARPLCVEPDCSNQLYAKSIDTLPAPEQNIRLGSGYFGPNSPNYTIKMMNHQTGAYWFYRQILLLSKGKAAAPRLGSWAAFIGHLVTEVGTIFRRKRAR